MPWVDKVKAWKEDEVTKAFFSDIENDISNLLSALVETDDTTTMLRLQGMLRALKGVMGMVEDGIDEPLTEKE